MAIIRKDIEIQTDGLTFNRDKLSKELQRKLKKTLKNF